MTDCTPILPDLPDPIWLKILGYIDDSLLLCKLHFSASIPIVIRRVAGDFQLWKKVHIVNPHNRGRLRKIVSFLGRHTRYDLLFFWRFSHKCIEYDLPLKPNVASS